MKVFFSDLDNTLIYSHRTPIKGGKVLVELLNGKEQSYMTEFSFTYLRDASWLSIIPVTTRSREQYQRLMLPEVFHIKYALVCNGGKLLINGIEDLEWSAKTLNMVKDDQQDLARLSELLHSLCKHEVQCPEPYYHYAKVDAPEEICNMLRSGYQKDNILIEHDHSKVYLFPQKINKGEAVKRFSKRYGAEFSVGAGDSSLDLPMLNEVDYPLASGSVYEYVHSPEAKHLAGSIISDQICQELDQLHTCGLL